jgi:3-isopropylmalate dehydrogenase
MKIAVLPGDGIGPEVTAEAVRVLKAVLGSSQAVELVEAPIGQAGIDSAGDPLPPATLAIARAADAILFGSAGMPGDEAIPFAMRPGASLLRLRQDLGLFANFRPAFLFPELIGASTLKPEVIEGLDLMILRELTGDVYFGEPRGSGTNARGERESPRWSASRTSPSAPRVRAGASSARWTRPMCWRSCSCGARW